VVIVQAPRKPDTAVVQVYRAGKASQQMFEKGDSTVAIKPDTL
jgi:hypothetical protein